MRGADVPVWRGELYFEMHRGTLTSQLRTKLGNRRCERALFEAELWEATVGERPRPTCSNGSGARPIADIWPDVLTQQFHDILPGSSIAWVHRDAELRSSPVPATSCRTDVEVAVGQLEANGARARPGRR